MRISISPLTEDPECSAAWVWELGKLPKPKENLEDDGGGPAGDTSASWEAGSMDVGRGGFMVGELGRDMFGRIAEYNGRLG